MRLCIAGKINVSICGLFIGIDVKQNWRGSTAQLGNYLPVKYPVHPSACIDTNKGHNYGYTRMIINLMYEVTWCT